MSYRKQTVIFLLILFLLSTILVFYQFTNIPKNLSFDEVDFAKLALSLQNTNYAVYSPLATGHSTLYFYILLGSMKLFGINSFALRFSSAVFGVLNVLMIFLIMRKFFKNNLIAFATAMVFLSLRWYFNFARFSFEATFLLFLELISVYFLQEFLDRNKHRSMLQLILSAVFAGLAFHSYYPGRIFFLVPAIWILISAPKKYFLLFISVSGIIMMPLLWHNAMQPDVRVSQISFLSDPKIPLDFKITGVLTNITKTILMPFINGDMNGRHNFPGKAALNPILGLLFLFGIIISYPSRQSLFFFLWMIISIIPTILSSPSDNPNMLRTFTLIPSIVYFIGAAIFWIYKYGQKTKTQNIIYPILIALFIISAGYELRTYFAFQSRVFSNSFEVTCDLKDVVYKPIVPKSCRVQKNMF